MFWFVYGGNLVQHSLFEKTNLIRSHFYLSVEQEKCGPQNVIYVLLAVTVNDQTFTRLNQIIFIKPR